MREIEFRAWANNTMYYFVELTSFKDGSLGIGVAEDAFHNMHTASSDVVVMQYTGLKDAKGNKIFEGDLVTDEQGQILTTEFYNGAFCAKSKSGSMWPFSNYLLPYVNVIGNKYQHGELLNE